MCTRIDLLYKYKREKETTKKKRDERKRDIQEEPIKNKHVRGFYQF